MALLGGIAVLALRSPASDAAKGDRQPKPALKFTPSQIVHLESHPLELELELPGTVTAMSQATVRSKLSAVVREVHVREGDAVVSGQVLAEFDAAPLMVLKSEREASLEVARANLVQFKRTRETNAQLVQQSFITQNAFENADSAYQAQLATVAAAQAQLAQVQLQLDDAVVHAPISGIVSQRFVQPGEKVGVDAQLVSIVDLRHLEVLAEAAVSDVARMGVGMPVDVRIEGLSGVALRGRIDRINPSAEAGSRSIGVYVGFANDKGLVRAGMFAHARLHLASDGALPSLPVPAVQQVGGQSIVWEVRDGHLVRHIVSLGRRDERAQRVEILGGVDPAQALLATRFDELEDGAGAVIVGATGTPAP